MEDGYYRRYSIDPNYIPADEVGINVLEKWMLHALDLGANYWSLWTESANLAQYYERYPKGFDTLRRRMGYRVRPSWVWQRKRYNTDELIVAFVNDGVAGIPGVLRVYIESLDGRFRIGGGLDAGHPFGGKLRQASFVLPKGMDGQQLKIRAEIETKAGIRRPVSWSCAQPLNTDGSLLIQLIRRDDKRWRKGV
jgi:hypothetical protein